MFNEGLSISVIYPIYDFVRETTEFAKCIMLIVPQLHSSAYTIYGVFPCPANWAI